MSNAKNTAFGLIIGLIMLAPAEWGRVRGWFEDLRPLKRTALAVMVAVFIVICLAIVLVPIVWEWLQYLT